MSVFRSRAAVTAVAALGLVVPLAMATPVLAQVDEPFVSEFHYDNAGTDTGEAIEIQAEPGTDLTGWSVVLYNGTGGAPYNTRGLSGVVGDSSVVVLDYPVNGIQNGSPDGLALVDAGGAVAEFLSYEGTFTAASPAPTSAWRRTAPGRPTSRCRRSTAPGSRRR
ncbi:MAG: hypothetical protein ACRDWI_16670 [Jiangellaceae bacterium]